MEGILISNKYKELIKNIFLDKNKSKDKDKITEVKYNNISSDKIYEKIKNIYKKFFSFQNNNNIVNKTKIPNLQKSVKSLYILKHIFSFITKKSKFKLIIYNKEFQNRFKIDIEDHKKESGKYKIAEKNGKGIEYDIYTNKKNYLKEII